eukprot:5124705-Pyramimonas_sp.AAC.1
MSRSHSSSQTASARRRLTNSEEKKVPWCMAQSPSDGNCQHGKIMTGSATLSDETRAQWYDTGIVWQLRYLCDYD